MWSTVGGWGGGGEGMCGALWDTVEAPLYTITHRPEIPCQPAPDNSGKAASILQQCCCTQTCKSSVWDVLVVRGFRSPPWPKRTCDAPLWLRRCPSPQFWLRPHHHCPPLPLRTCRSGPNGVGRTRLLARHTHTHTHSGAHHAFLAVAPPCSDNVHGERNGNRARVKVIRSLVGQGPLGAARLAGIARQRGAWLGRRNGRLGSGNCQPTATELPGASAVATS